MQTISQSKQKSIITLAKWVKEGRSLRALSLKKKHGELISISSGLWVTPDFHLTQETIAQVLSLKHPDIIVNSISALSLHGLTTQIPSALYFAMPRSKRRPPRVHIAPIEVSLHQDTFMQIGKEVIHGKYGNYCRFDAERCLVDAFANRNKIGIDIFLESFALYSSSAKTRPSVIAEYALLLHQFKNMEPYLLTLS